MHVAEIVYSFSMLKNESFEQTQDRLRDARNLFLELLSAAAPKSNIFENIEKAASADNPIRTLSESMLNPDIYYHNDELFHEFMNVGFQDTEDFAFKIKYISSFAAALIERPWLDSHFMEWIIVDSLVCEAIRETGRSILENVGNLRSVLFRESDIFVDKGMKRLLFIRERGKIMAWAMRIILFIIIPVFGIWYGLQNGNAWILLVSGAIGATYLLWNIYVTIRAEIMRLLGRQLPKTELQEKLERLGSMIDAYRTLDGRVVDPTRVKRALEAAAEKGVFWPSAIYPVLNRVIARDPTAWVTDDSHSYRPREDRQKDLPHRPEP